MAKMRDDVLKSLSDYVVNLTSLKFSGRLTITLDFYQGGIRCATRTLEESLSVSGIVRCAEPTPD